MKRKETFLKQLEGFDRYKQYLGSPLRYAGGKSRGVGYIIEQIPTNVSKVVSPFMGGGSVEIALANELGVQVEAFDIFDILVNYWKHQIEYAGNMAQILSKWDPTKQQYNSIKDTLKAHWSKESFIEDSLELAARYWFNHNLSYGPAFLGWISSIYKCSIKYRKMVEKVQYFTCPLLSVNVADFRNVLVEYNRECLYLDPPYYLTNSKMFAGIYPSRYSPIYHNNFNHKLLRDLVYSHKADFVLSYNDCEVIRDWYKEFRIIPVKWQYTMGQGETRIGENRKKNNATHIKKSHEIIITNVNEKRIGFNKQLTLF